VIANYGRLAGLSITTQAFLNRSYLYVAATQSKLEDFVFGRVPESGQASLLIPMMQERRI
jgi:hypothetical protein